MKVSFTANGFEQYLHWQAHDARMLERINELIKMIRRMPFGGIGRPEPLLGEYKGWWSRRIDSEHRFVYRVLGKGDDQMLEIASSRYHYQKR